MSINFPTFVDKEIPSPEKFNEFVQALEAKFTSGLGSAEIQWPLVAAGNLVLSGYEITGGKKFMKIVNAGDTTYTNNFEQALIDGAGGAVFIPPNTTVSLDGGVLPGNSIAIIGAGPSSIIQLSGGTAGYLLRSSSPSRQVTIANLTLDGNSEASAGLVLRGVNRAFVHNVRFTNFGQPALQLTSVDGTACSNVVISNCIFRAGNDHHILGDDCSSVTVQGCQSLSCDTSAFEFVAADTGALIKDINISDNVITDCDQSGIVVRGGSGTHNTNWSNITISDNVFNGAGQVSDPAIECGAVSAVVQHFSVSGNQIYNAAVDAIKVYGKYGHVSGNNAQGAGQHGVNCTTSAYVSVTGNDLQGATNVGIQATNASTDVVVQGNNLLNCTTAIQFSDDVYMADNAGVLSPGYTQTYFTNSLTITIPANLLGPDVHMRVRANGDATSGAAGTFELHVNGQTVAGAAVDGGGSPGQVYLAADMVVTGATTLDSMFNSYAEGTGTHAVGRYQLTGLNYAADVVLDTATTGSTVARQGLVVELSRYEDQS